jgi:hypothetical protein
VKLWFVRNCHDDDDEIVVARVSVVAIAINTVVVVDKGMRGFIVVLSWSFVCCVLLLHRLIQNKHRRQNATFFNWVVGSGLLPGLCWISANPF